jgi:hypothetical protein
MLSRRPAETLERAISSTPEEDRGTVVTRPLCSAFCKGAYVVIVMWGIKAASYLLVLIAMALLLAYAFVPLPQWLMSSRSRAMALTVALLGMAERLAKLMPCSVATKF